MQELRARSHELFLPVKRESDRVISFDSDLFNFVPMNLF